MAPRYLDLELIPGECPVTGTFRDRALKQCLAQKENCRELSNDGAMVPGKSSTTRPCQRRLNREEASLGNSVEGLKCCGEISANCEEVVQIQSFRPESLSLKPIPLNSDQRLPCPFLPASTFSKISPLTK